MSLVWPSDDEILERRLGIADIASTPANLLDVLVYLVKEYEVELHEAKRWARDYPEILNDGIASGAFTFSVGDELFARGSAADSRGERKEPIEEPVEPEFPMPDLTYPPPADPDADPQPDPSSDPPFEGGGGESGGGGASGEW